MTSPHSSPRKLGIGMYTIAWCCLFILLALFFQEQIDDQYNPNHTFNSQTNQQGQVEVILKPNRQHHYVTQGSINGQPVIFMLDTGATDVVVPKNLADTLQLRAGRSATANTANGKVRVYATQLASLKIDKIQLFNVRASINPNMPGQVILLGMSALKQIEFSQKDELLILRQ